MDSTKAPRLAEGAGHPPVDISSFLSGAITPIEHPEAAGIMAADAIVISNGPDLAVPHPPCAMDTLQSVPIVGASDRMVAAA